MAHLRALLAASFLICCLLTVVATAQDQKLQLGTPVERQLAAGQSHNFNVSLEENTFIQLVVEQRGIDVVVKISNPDGKDFGRFDTPNGNHGPENVSFVAPAAGTYRITVTPLNQDAAEGSYEIKIIEVREATEQEFKSSKNMEGIKDKGIALIGDAEGLMQEVRTPETRLRAQLQASQMLSELDEKRATKFLNDAAAGLRELVANIDPADPELLENYGGITQLRFEIVQTLAARDPDAAISLLKATRLPSGPYSNQRDMELQENGLELMIADQIVAKDPKRAVEIARRKLKSGYSPNLINTIAGIRSKNPELATELANEIVSKLVQETLLKKPDAANLSVNLLYSCRSKERVLPGFDRGANVFQGGLISEQSCRDLFQKALQDALSLSTPTPHLYTPERETALNLLNGLQQLGPELNENVSGGLAQVEKKLSELSAFANPNQANIQKAYVAMNGPIEEAVESIEKMPEEAQDQLYIQLANTASARGDGNAARQIINTQISNPYQRRQALSNLEQQEMYQAMSQGNVEETLKMIGALKKSGERANMLMQITQQIGPGHKRAAALSLLEQARALLAPGIHAQDQDQMIALLELARMFARYDAKRAFEIVDPLVDQFNDILTAARTMNGFGLNYYRNDELDILQGNNLSGISAAMSTTLAGLAMTNFERAKTTADRLRQPEVKLKAYLEIAQQAIRGAK